MSTLGDVADVNPVIKFLPHTCNVFGRIDFCRVTKGGHIEHLLGRTETWSVSPSVDMFPFGVTFPATVPQRSEFPEGLMNYPVLCKETLNTRKCRSCLISTYSYCVFNSVKDNGFMTSFPTNPYDVFSCNIQCLSVSVSSICLRTAVFD